MINITALQALSEINRLVAITYMHVYKHDHAHNSRAMSWWDEMDQCRLHVISVENDMLPCVLLVCMCALHYLII